MLAFCIHITSMNFRWWYIDSVIWHTYISWRRSVCINVSFSSEIYDDSWTSCNSTMNENYSYGISVFSRENSYTFYLSFHCCCCYFMDFLSSSFNHLRACTCSSYTYTGICPRPTDHYQYTVNISSRDFLYTLKLFPPRKS